MIQLAVKRLQYLIEVIPAKLLDIPEDMFAHKPAIDKWSMQEVLGHLIDSATNNHQRFIRAQYEATPTITYNQNKWNELNHYQQANRTELIQLWALYNTHLLHIINSSAPTMLTSVCNTGGDTPVTVASLIDDYVQHMEHHLKTIVAYT